MSSVLERAAILGQGERLAVAAALGLDAGPVRSPSGAGDGKGRLLTLDEATREHIQGVLTHTKGRVSGEHGAALLLGVNANTLRAKMRKLKIKPKEFKKAG